MTAAPQQPPPTLAEELRRLHLRLDREADVLPILSLEFLASELARMAYACRRELDRRQRDEERAATRLWRP